MRFSFADQHGVLRGKTLLAGESASAMKSGVNMTTTLLAKDTAHKTVFPVFTAGGGFNMPEMQGGADFVMVPDPATFRVLPWAPNTGWLLCDIYFANGKPVPFSSRRLYREALSRLSTAGFDFLAGLEVEFHLFGITNPHLAPEDATWPPAPPDVSLLAQGYQLLTETRFDQIDGALEPIRKAVEALGLPLRSIEIRAGAEPGRIHLPHLGRDGRGGRHGAVPLGGEAGGAAQRLSRQLHVPPRASEHDVERLASASIADRAQTQDQRLCSQRSRRALHRRAVIISAG